MRRMKKHAKTPGYSREKHIHPENGKASLHSDRKSSRRFNNKMSLICNENDTTMN